MKIHQVLKAKTPLFLLLLTILITACNQSTVYSKYITLPEAGWEQSNRLNYDVEVTDNNTLNNIYLNVRHTDAYPFSNLFVFLTTTYPNGKKSIDTLQCILANSKGEWIGDGAGDIFDNKLLVTKNIRFPEVGTYHFSFEQGMRVNPLPLIMDFGITIEKSK